MDVSVTIQRLRREAHLSQGELAARVGVSNATICQWEAGTTQPNLGALQRLAHAFNTTPSSIIDFKRPVLGSICVPERLTKIPLDGPAEGEPTMKQESIRQANVTKVPRAVCEKHPRVYAFSIEASYVHPLLPGQITFAYDPYLMPATGDLAVVHTSPTQNEIRRWQLSEAGIPIRGIELTGLEYDGASASDYPIPVGTVCWYQSTEMLL